MDAVAIGSNVTNVTYTGNVGFGLRNFGVLIDQSYPSTLATPGTGVVLDVRASLTFPCPFLTEFTQGVEFVGATNTFFVSSSATPIAINCGNGTCIGESLPLYTPSYLTLTIHCFAGSWNWSRLQTHGGKANFFVNPPNILGFRNSPS